MSWLGESGQQVKIALTIMVTPGETVTIERRALNKTFVKPIQMMQITRAKSVARDANSRVKEPAVELRDINQRVSEAEAEFPRRNSETDCIYHIPSLELLV